MTESVSTDAIRVSALALLASGNSFESVAHVFGVPLETLRAWAAESKPCSHLPAAAPFASPLRPSATEALPRTMQHTVFPKAAVYRMSVGSRFAGLALVPLTLSGPVFAWPFVFDGASSPVAVTVLMLVTVTLAILAACAARFALNTRFQMSPHSITGYGLGHGVTLALARIEALTATRMRQSTSTTVVLHPVAGTRPLKIQAEEQHLRDKDLYEWLASIPLRGGGAIHQPAAASKTPAWQRAILFVVSTALGSLCLIYGVFPWQIDEARAVATGYPPLANLSLTEGTVTRVGACWHGHRSAPYLPVTIATAAGEMSESLNCDVAPSLRATTGPHHLAVWRDERRFSDGVTREIDIDGVAVRSYADYIARDRRFAPFNLVGGLMLDVMFLLLECGLVAAIRTDE